MKGGESHASYLQVTRVELAINSGDAVTAVSARGVSGLVSRSVWQVSFSRSALQSTPGHGQFNAAECDSRHAATLSWAGKRAARVSMIDASAMIDAGVSSRRCSRSVVNTRMTFISGKRGRRSCRRGGSRDMHRQRNAWSWRQTELTSNARHSLAAISGSRLTYLLVSSYRTLMQK